MVQYSHCFKQYIGEHGIVTLIPTFGILYVLMLRKSSRFLVFRSNIKNFMIDGYNTVINS